MQSAKIKRILKENKELFKTLENYDKTRELPFQRKRIDITLSAKTIRKLKELSAKTSKPISRIIEESIEESPSAQSPFKKHKQSNLNEQILASTEPFSSYIG